MKLTPPKFVTFIVSVVIALLGLLGKLGVVAALAKYDLWLVLAGFVLLALACLLKDL